MKSKLTFAAAVAAACAAVVASAAGTASAQVALAAPAKAQVALAAPVKVAQVPSKTIWVGVDHARLRSGPTTSRPNVVGKVMSGQGFTATCWTQENFHPTGGYIWYYGNPWGSSKWGYMRVDMFRDGHDNGGVLRRC